MRLQRFILSQRKGLDIYKISVTLIHMKNNNPIKVINHVGFILDLKAAHRGMGTLRLAPRNKNRKQFYPEKNRTRTTVLGRTMTYKSRFQQDLPAKYATHFAFYGNENTLQAVVNIYKKAGIDVIYKAAK